MRPLLPLRVVDSDHGDFRDGGMLGDRVLEFDAGDPLAATLDAVLEPVLQLDPAPRIDHAQIPGSQPAVAELGAVRVAEIGAGDRVAGHLDLTLRQAVPRLYDALLVDDPCANSRHDSSRPGGPADHLVRRGAGWGARVGEQGRRLGHAPALGDLEAVRLVDLPRKRR